MAEGPFYIGLSNVGVLVKAGDHISFSAKDRDEIYFAKNECFLILLLDIGLIFKS